jgi:hypothetical protein
VPVIDEIAERPADAGVDLGKDAASVGSIRVGDARSGQDAVGALTSK